MHINCLGFLSLNRQIKCIVIDHISEDICPKSAFKNGSAIWKLLKELDSSKQAKTDHIQITTMWSLAAYCSSNQMWKLLLEIH